jgi:hypothetical protein
LASNLQDIEALKQGVVPGTRVVILDPNRPPLIEISDYLAQTPGLQSLHIVCHGRPGALHFADQVIDRGELAAYQTQLQSWQDLLAADAAVSLYACELGAGAVGLAFVQTFSQLIDRPVAASTQIVGQPTRGGDWQLALRTGKIPTPLAFTQATQRDYAGVFNNFDVQLSNLGQAGGLWLNGNARQVGDALQLTSGQALQSSSSYSVTPVAIDGSTSFKTSFQFRMGGVAGRPNADGFTFVLQNAPTGIQTLGFNGGNMGYGGITNSLAIKFDTFLNLGIDTSDNSIAIVRDGSILTSVATAAAPFDLDGGQILTAWIDYDGGSDRLDVYLGDSNSKPGTAVLSSTIDLAAILGKQAYVGFTAATGVEVGQVDLLNWNWQPTSARSAADFPASFSTKVNLAQLSTDNLSLNGNARRIGSSIQLTNDAIAQRGSSFYGTPFQVNGNTGFSSQFKFQLEGAQGDGFAFVLQNAGAGVNALGAVGGSVGYAGIDRSVGIIFDTFQNVGDISANSIRIVQNGDLTPLANVALPFDLKQGSYNAWVDYDGATNQLSVFISEGATKPATAILTQTIDLPSLVGDKAFVGFTAGTGLVGSRQTITDWTFETELQVGQGDGLRAEYFDNPNFTNLKLVKIDPNVNYDWGAAAADPDLRPDGFSVRWFGQVQPLYSETYTFYTTSDDGARLTVNGQVLVNQLVDQGATEWNGTITLEAGKKYDIVLEYFENTGDALASLSWSSESQQKQVIPQSQLYTTPYKPGTFLMGSNSLTVRENAGTVAVRIDRVGGSDGYATISYNTVDLSAAPDLDFTALNTNVTFLPGETSKTINVAILDDPLIETNEEFGVALGQAAGAGLGGRRTVGVTILDDDAGVAVFNLANATAQVNEGAAAGTVSLTVQRSGDTTVAASVGYTTTNGTATATDYTATTGTINFAANEVSKTIVIPITNDNLTEVNETFTVTIDNPTAGRLGTRTSTVVTIADDDVTGEFIRERVVGGFNLTPTAADGTQMMFVIEQGGVVKTVRNGANVGTFLDISDEVNGVRDRGLIGIAIHPQFYQGSPYIYLAYTYDPPEAANAPNGSTAGRDGVGNRPSRLIRVTADAATGYTTAVAGSQVVLLGKNSTWANTSRPDLNSTNDFTVPSSGGSPGNWTEDYLATDSESHSIGDVTFGPDGYLYVTNGDGTSYSARDPRALRVGDVDNLSGKMLRIDPITGAGVPGNPFYDAANPNSNRSKVVNLGFRNPFRFTFSPDGTPVIGDVGWTQTEEINVGFGKNFGWPYLEGNDPTSYQLLPGANFDPANLTAPSYTTAHNGSPSAIVVGDFYEGPARDFQGGLFVSDYSKATVDVVFFNADGTTVDTSRTRRFATGVVTVQMISGPDGSMYFNNLLTGSIERWRYV